MSLPEIARLVAKPWDTRTLDQLRQEALAHEDGMARELLASGERRLALVACVTKAEHIKVLEEAFEFVGEDDAEDWHRLTLGELWRRTAEASGFAFSAMRDLRGARSVLILCATEGEPIHQLGSLLGILA